MNMLDYLRNLRNIRSISAKPAGLTTPRRLLALAALFHDLSYLDAAKTCGITDDPIRVAEFAETLSRKEDVEHWLTVAAEAVDTDAMRWLINDFEHGDVQRFWMWLYLAEMLGSDLTKSHMQAFHDEGKMQMKFVMMMLADRFLLMAMKGLN